MSFVQISTKSDFMVPSYDQQTNKDNGQKSNDYFHLSVNISSDFLRCANYIQSCSWTSGVLISYPRFHYHIISSPLFKFVWAHVL